MNTPNSKTLLRKGTHIKWRLLSLELKDNVVDGVRVGCYYHAGIINTAVIPGMIQRGVGATPLAAVTLAIDAPLN